MTSRDFAYFLQGFFEISEPKTIGEKETEMIKKHLALVFKHEIDPSMGDQKHQDELNAIHNGAVPAYHHMNPPSFPDDRDVLRC